MAITRQLNVFLANKPGQLAVLCRALAAAKVNITAISVCDTVDHGVVRLVTDKTGAARAILKKRKIPFTDNQVISVKMSNKPGALAAASAALAKVGVNIEYLYGSTTAAGEIATIIMRVSDAKKAAKALK